MSPGQLRPPLDPALPSWLFADPSHVGIVCEDIDATIADHALLGYQFVVRSGPVVLRRPGLGDQEPFVARSAWSLQGPPHIELGEVAGLGPEPHLWEARGHDYVDHHGFWVDDLAAASRLLEEMGFPLEATPGGDPERPLGFCYHRTPNGARIELEDGPMRKALLADQFARVRAGDTSTLDYVPFSDEA